MPDTMGRPNERVVARFEFRRTGVVGLFAKNQPAFSRINGKD
jgi:hypothetical protein